MKHIEIKSEGYTYRYDFEPVPTTAGAFKPYIIVPVKSGAI